MLTLITGNPRTGKTLYTVAELLGDIPGSKLTVAKGGQVDRVLYSNVDELLIEHERIGPDELNTWHEWAKPGTVICFDEVQEVWRPRSFGTKVPDAIAAIETHGHMGVDIILITQHPMLLDANIRRLVNRHIHVRRLSGSVTWLYEWDHCSNPHATKSCVSTRMWKYNKKAFKLYKSADAHTKPVTRPPMVALLAIPALAVAGYFGYTSFQNIANRDEIAKVEKADTKSLLLAEDGTKAQATPDAPINPSTSTYASGQWAPRESLARVGCVASQQVCRCYFSDGTIEPVEPDACHADVGGPAKVLTARQLPDAPPIVPVEASNSLRIEHDGAILGSMRSANRL